MAVEIIRISCEGAPGPGLAWSIIVEFRPLSRGYSVWVFENNVVTDRPQWRKIAGKMRPLTWRAAYEALVENENLRVFGDFWFETEIDGLPDWAANILRFAFIVDEEGPYDYRCLGDLLVGFTDKEIQDIVPSVGLNPFEKPFSEDEEDQSDFQKLASFASIAVAAGLSGRPLQEIRSELGVDSKATLDDMEVMLAERAADIKHMSEQNRLVEFVDRSKEKKAIEQPTETHGNDDAYSRRREWETIFQGSLPDDFEKHIELISLWISEPEKPRSDNRVGGITESGSEWPILKWLLGFESNRMSNILAELVKQRPGLAISLAEEVMRRGKKSAYYFEGPNRFLGWAQNVIGRHIHRAHVEFALGFQAKADSLGIAFDEQNRISELPYLNV